MFQRPSFQGYTKPDRYAPQWYVGNLVFQGGNPRQRMGSLTGGGQEYGHEYRAFNRPFVKTYTPPIVSVTGPGQINARPPFLASLFGGQVGNGS